MNIGKKICECRKSTGVTQKDLCGEKITRNMLSAIENGRATPSLDTLLYIADKLDVPLSYLLDDSSDLWQLKKASAIAIIQKAYKDERYSDCIKLISDLEGCDDELALMLAFSYFEVAKQSLFRGTLLTAHEQLELSKKYCDLTIYDTSRISAVLPIYMAVAKNIQSPLLEFDIKDLDNSAYIDSYEFYKYISLDTDYKYANPLFAKHMQAKSLIKSRNYKSALKVLIELEDTKRHDTYNAYAYFSIYTDIESCYKQLADFENAYRYSNKRMSMLEGFKT